MRVRSLLLAWVAVPAVLAGAAAANAQTDPWPMPGGPPRGSGAVEGPAPPYRVAWEAELEDTAVAGPAVGDGVVVVVGRRSVVALDAQDGAERWVVDRAPGPSGGATLAGSLAVYAEGTDEETRIVAVDRRDGEEAWRTDLEGAASGPIATGDGAVYVGTRRGDVFALSSEDGSELWTFESRGRAESAPVVANDMVFLTSHDLDDRTGIVYGLDARTGTPEWRFRPEGNIVGFSSPRVVGDTVFAGTGDLRARALDAATGDERWETRLRAPFSQASIPVAAGDALVIGDLLGHVYALDAGSGVERWVYRLPGLLTRTSVSVSGGTVLVGDGSGQVSAIDLEEGTLVWKRTFGDERAGEVAVTEERLYVAPNEGPVTALEHDPSGTLLDEPSPTELFLGTALGGYGIAFVLVLGLVLVGDRFLGRKEGSAGGA